MAAGPPAEVLDEFGVATFAELFSSLAARPARRGVPTAVRPDARRRRRSPAGAGRLRQWLVLTRRSAETVLRNRLTLGILVGSPAAVIAMFAVLLRPDAFDPAAADATAAPMVLVLRLLGRLPALPADVVAPLFLTLSLNAVAALALGLLASAVVRSTAQAALALPMLCFPAVLFAGAMVPVPSMTGTGRAIAVAMPDRWAFEAIARHLDVATVVGPSSPHAHLGASSTGSYWLLLVGFTAVLLLAARAAVRQKAAEVGR